MPKIKNDPYRMEMIKTIQNNLTSLMDARGWDNVDLADHSGLALSDITKYRRIEYNTLPRVTELAKLCEVFNVSFDFLIGLDPSKRYSHLSDDEKQLLDLYSIANNRDRLLIQTILQNYSTQDTNQAVQG